MARRYAKQVQEESYLHGEFRRVRIAKDLWKSYSKQLQRQGKRYKVFRQKGGILEVIANVEQGKPLPQDFDELTDLLDDLLEGMEPGKKVSGSRGFGGEYSGHRGKGKSGRYVTFRVPFQEAKARIRKKAQEARRQADGIDNDLDNPGNDGSVRLETMSTSEIEQLLHELEPDDKVMEVREDKTFTPPSSVKG